MFVRCLRFGFNSLKEPDIPNHVFSSLKSLHQLFQDQYKAAKYREALEHCDEYLSIVQQYYDEGHPAHLSMTNNKGIVLNKIGRFQEALEIQKTVA